MSGIAEKPRAGSRLFGSVTAENADAVIRDVSNTWYVIAALQGVVIGVLVYLGQSAGGDLLDPIVCALGGYYLRSRKSRALAVALLVYSLFLLVSTVMNILGQTHEGGTNIFLSLIIIFAAFRGVMATWIIQRRDGARTRWGRVIIVTLLAIVIGFVSLVAMGIAIPSAMQLGMIINASTINFLYTLAIVAPVAITFAAFTARWPLADKTAGVERVFT